MKATSRAVVCSAILFAFCGAAFAQGAGGTGGAGAGGGGGGTAGQGGTGMSTPNAGGTTGASSSPKGTTNKSPTRMPQNEPHAKGASDTAASGAQ